MSDERHDGQHDGQRHDQDRHVGLWITVDGRIRHRLLPARRYDEARGTREHACQGRYHLTGDHIDYVDDAGFTADGDFREGVLYHAGMVLRRVDESTAARGLSPARTGPTRA